MKETENYSRFLLTASLVLNVCFAISFIVLNFMFFTSLFSTDILESRQLNEYQFTLLLTIVSLLLSIGLLVISTVLEQKHRKPGALAILLLSATYGSLFLFF